MTDMARSRAVISWDNGGPGVVTYHWTAGFPAGAIDGGMVDDFHQEIAGLWTLLKGNLVQGLKMSVAPEVDIIDPATGNITGVVLATGPTDVVTGTSTSYLLSRGTQCVVNLWTDNFSAGKRLRGRHYLGPLAGSAFDNDGTLLEAFRATVENSYTAMTSGVGGRLAVWHRPTSRGASDGFYGDVVTVRTKDKPGNLRSRRD